MDILGVSTRRLRFFVAYESSMDRAIMSLSHVNSQLSWEGLLDWQRLHFIAERFFLIYVVKNFPVTRLPNREISLPGCYPVIYYLARVCKAYA